MWSDRYIGVKYDFYSRNIECGANCLTLLLAILKDEFGYDAHMNVACLSEDWYKVKPAQMIEEAVKRGEVIKNISDLRAGDLVFFKITEEFVNHMGMMVDDYDNFIHQLKDQTSRLDKTKHAVWSQLFFCGIRLSEVYEKLHTATV